MYLQLKHNCDNNIN